MKIRTSLLLVAAGIFLGACASFPPSSADIASAQQLRFDQPLPKDGKYVVLYPAGTPLPVSVVMGGNLFEQEQQAMLHVVLKRNIYVYGQFASFDRTHWISGPELITAEVKLEIPQKGTNNAGQLRLNLNQK